MPDKVRNIFISRARQLMTQYEGSKSIGHGTTVGTMREDYLRTFLYEVLPPRFHPLTGFVCDMYGNITPQLDMVFIDHSELPTISLVNDTVVVPYEIALLMGEVKSTITTETIDQIKEQRDAIARMQSHFLTASSTPNRPQPRTRRQNIGAFIVAFESDVSEDRLRQWVETEMGNPAGICVMNSNGGILSIFYQVFSRQIEILRATDPSDYDPLLTFVAALYRWLDSLFLHNSTMSDEERDRFTNTHARWVWEGYLSEYLFAYLQGLADKGASVATSQDTGPENAQK